MILSLEEYRAFNPADKTADSVLVMKLKGIESAVRRYTNNNFQRRGIRLICPIAGGIIAGAKPGLIFVGDTVHITQSAYNIGTYEVTATDDNTITVNEVLNDEAEVMVTKVVYPPDIRLGVANLLKWDYLYRDKAGIASESVSRHSITYGNLNEADNALLGYPAGLMGFLKPHMKARF